MYIVLNGKKFQVNKKDTIAQLLKKIDIKSSKVAIEVNKVVVPKEKYWNFKFKVGYYLFIIQKITKYLDYVK